MKKIKKMTAFNFYFAFACIVFVGACPLEAGIRQTAKKMQNAQFSAKPKIPLPNVKDAIITPIVINTKQESKTVATSSLVQKAYAAQYAKNSSDNPCIQWQQVWNSSTGTPSLVCAAFEK